MKLLLAAPYDVLGKSHTGKIHAIKEDERTYCGTELRYTGGSISEGARESVSCRGCMRSLDTAAKQEQEQQKWEEQRAEREKQRQEESEQWWAWYSKYLQTDAWARRRRLVLSRSGGLCEGCREDTAVIAHHITYAHVGNELLFELVALCRPCHQMAHPNKAL